MCIEVLSKLKLTSILRIYFLGQHIVFIRDRCLDNCFFRQPIPHSLEYAQKSKIKNYNNLKIVFFKCLNEFIYLSLFVLLILYVCLAKRMSVFFVVRVPSVSAFTQCQIVAGEGVDRFASRGSRRL